MTTYTLTRAELEAAKEQRALAGRIEAARAQGRAEMAARITAILSHSFKRMGCDCNGCNNVANGLAFEPMLDGHDATVRKAIEILNKVPPGACGRA